MKNLLILSAVAFVTAGTNQMAKSAVLALTDDIIVAADATVVPFGDPSSANSGGPQLPNPSAPPAFIPSGAAFRYAVRERANANQTNRRVVSFLEFDTSGLTPADVNAAGFAATMTIEHVGHLNNLNTGMDVSVGRNVSGAWDSAAGGDPNPQYAWASASADQAVVLADVHLAPGSVALSYDVTSIVQGWVNGTNDGLVFFGTQAAANGGNNSINQGSYLINPVITTIPEPSSLGLVGLGLIGLLSRRRR